MLLDYICKPFFFEKWLKDTIFVVLLKGRQQLSIQCFKINPCDKYSPRQTKTVHGQSESIHRPIVQLQGQYTISNFIAHQDFEMQPQQYLNDSWLLLYV